VVAGVGQWGKQCPCAAGLLGLTLKVWLLNRVTLICSDYSISSKVTPCSYIHDYESYNRGPFSGAARPCLSRVPFGFYVSVESRALAWGFITLPGP
jgi:hypothetical protein